MKSVTMETAYSPAIAAAMTNAIQAKSAKTTSAWFRADAATTPIARWAKSASRFHDNALSPCSAWPIRIANLDSAASAIDASTSANVRPTPTAQLAQSVTVSSANHVPSAESIRTAGQANDAIWATVFRPAARPPATAHQHGSATRAPVRHHWSARTTINVRCQVRSASTISAKCQMAACPTPTARSRCVV